MKDYQNGRQPKWKMTKMEDDQNGRRPKWKTTKWENSGLWKEIVEEGNVASTKMSEAVKILHIPHTTPMGLKDPEPPPGFKRMKYEPKNGGRVFQLLLNLSTQVF